jgi:NMD protein affecting ribosome stability and mRNA decay
MIKCPVCGAETELHVHEPPMCLECYAKEIAFKPLEAIPAEPLDAMPEEI